MISEEKKGFILDIIKNGGSCYVSLRLHREDVCSNMCVLTGRDECLHHENAYKKAVDWAMTYCKEELLEILI